MPEIVPSSRDAYLAALLRMYGSVQLPIRLDRSGETPRLPLQAILQPLRLRRDPLAAGEEQDQAHRTRDQDDEYSGPEQDKHAVMAADGREALALSPGGRMVVLGPPGCGKTTLLQDLLCQAARRAQQDLAVPLPLFLFLPDLARTGLSLEAYLALVAGGMGLSAAFGQILWQALCRGQALCCLDGLDEVAPVDRQGIIAVINDGALRYGSVWVIGSRYSDYKSGQFAHAHFSEWELQPLDAASRRLLARRLLHTLQDESQTDDGVDLDAAADALVARVERGAHAAWAGNPLLLSLVTAVYARGHHLPATRAALYRAMVAAILSIREPDPVRQQALHAVLAQLALALFQRKGRSFSRALLRSHLADLGHTGPGGEALVERVIGCGLLDALGVESYAFSHQTFQEYLAAVALAAGMLDPHPATRRTAQELAWSRRTFSRWTEVLVLLAGVLAQDHGATGAGEAHRWIQALAGQQTAPDGDPGDLGLALALRCLAEVGEPEGVTERTVLLDLAQEVATRWAQDVITECRRYDDEYALEYASRYQRLRQLAEAVARLPTAVVDAAAESVAHLLSERASDLQKEAAAILATLSSPAALAKLEPQMDSSIVSGDVLRILAERAPTEWMAAQVLQLITGGSTYSLFLEGGMRHVSDSLPIEPLLAALHGQDAKRQKAAVQALGYLGARVPIDTWIAVAQDPDASIRQCGIQALGHWGAATAIPVLLAAAEDEDATTRMLAIQALAALGRPPVVESVLALARAAENLELGWDLAQALGAHGSQAMLDECISLLCADHEWVRALGIAGLQAAASMAPLEPILAALANPRPKVRCAALRVLGAMRGRIPLQILLDALLDDAAEVRQTALIALGAKENGHWILRRRHHWILLVFFIREFNPLDVVSAANQQLNPGNKTQLLAAVIKALDDPDTTVRVRAVNLLATWREQAPLQVVLHMLKDNDADVREEAIEALRPLISQVPPGHLLALLDDPDKRIREDIRRLIGGAGISLPVEDVLTFFANPRRSDQAHVCKAAIQVLASLGTNAPIAPLAAALRFPDPSVSAHARDALMAIEQPAQSLLREALGNQQPHVRAYAFQALWRLKAEDAVTLLAHALDDMPILPYHCSDKYPMSFLVPDGWLDQLAPDELLIAALARGDEDTQVGAGKALLARSKKGPIPELLPLLIRYGLIEEVSNNGQRSLRLAVDDALTCWFIAAIAGEQGTALHLDTRLESFSLSNHNLSWIHDAAFLTQWPYLPVTDLLAIANREDFTPWKRGMAVRALGRIMENGHPELVEPLLAFLRQDPPVLAEAALDALASVADRIPVDLLVREWIKNEHWRPNAAARIAAHLGDRAPIADVLELLRTEEPDSRQRDRIWDALKAVADYVPAQPIIAFFPQEADYGKRSILEILGSRAPREILRQAANGPSDWVRMKALELLGDEASFEAILPLVEAPHFENRGFAEPLLQLFGRVATSEQLIRVLDQSIYPEVRAAAVEALAHYHHPEARAALQRALYDEVAWVRNQALIVLAHKVSREQLLAAIADEDEQVRATALRLLQEVDPDALAPVIEEASAFLLGQGSGQVIGSLVQRSIASAISELGRAPADLVAYVGELLDWPHLDVQREAAQALGKLRRNVPDRAIEKLLALRRTSIAPLVRRAADDTLSEILSLETGIEDDA